MSDSSSSAGSTGSSTNSWTLLSPEEAAVENVGPVDDGTESLGDVPSLSEDVTGAAASDIPVETVLSEEGHQVCQETSPESGEGPIPSSPTRMSPLPADLIDRLDLDLESQPPVIHDIVTSSPSDNEHLGATPFVTNMDSGALLDIAAADFLTAEPEECCSAPPLTETHPATEQVLDASADFGPSSVFAAEPEVDVAIETLTATAPPSCVDAVDDESTEPPRQVPESLGAESPINDSPAPETVGPVEAEEKEEEEVVEEVVVEEEVAGEASAAVEKEEMELPETVTQYEREQEEEEEEDDEEEEGGESSSTFELGETRSSDDGLRRRNAPSFESPRPRTSDEEDDEEEVEFKLAEKTEEKPWFSLNKCIVGSLILLFLGSLFLSGDFDDSELSDGEQNQDGLSSDPQDMKELLDKLTRENQQITQLETQLQSQKEELDVALEAVAASGDEKGEADLHKENVRLKEELLSLPELKKELESLRSRVTELSQLSADQEKPPATSSPQPGDKEGQSNEEAAGPESRKDTSKGGRLKEELQRQKVLLEESKKRLQGMRKDGGERKRVRNSLEEIQKKLSEQVDRWSKKKPQEAKWKGNKGKNNEREHWKKEVKKEWKHSKEGEEKKGKEWSSHKETWRKHQDEWEKKKDERRMDREERRKETPGKNSHDQHQQHHQHQHQHQQPHQRHQCQHDDYWRQQEQKLSRHVGARPGCGSAEACAAGEGLYPVELPEFEELLEGYLSKLEGSPAESKEHIRKLTAKFFQDGGFVHDRVRFGDFVEDVADILEDMADALEDADALETEMEEFEREALWKFAATV